MKIQILETLEMKLTRPQSIQEIFRAKDVQVYRRDTGESTYGDQVLLEGEFDAIKQWLTPFERVWFNFGAMQLEEFSLIDIAEIRKELL